MKILYLTDAREDYLQDQLLLGLRQQLGPDVVDYPRKDVMYASCSRPSRELYGRGFTLWKLLKDVEVDRSDLEPKVRRGHYDLVVFGSIRRQKKLFFRFLSRGLLTGASRGRFVFVDGQDGTRVFVAASAFGPYFKREQGPRTAPWARPISFSIPEQKIRAAPPDKHQRFGRHVQCPEAYRLPDVRAHCRPGYLFDDEASYYADLGASQYGFTMKKSGWDCMRHYEIAANHAVPLFFELERKPRRCAPHGLRDMDNVVAFDSARQCSEKLAAIDRDGLYPELQRRAVAWVRKKTCRAMAQAVVEAATSPRRGRA